MRIRLLVSAAAVVALLAPAPAANAAPKKRCIAKHATTVKKNSYARLFETPGRGGDETGRLWGCVYKKNRRVLLDTSSDDDYVASEAYGAVKLNRTKAAWEHTSTDISCKADCPPGYDGETSSIHVGYLGQRKEKIYSGDVVGNALVVTTSGAIAWFDVNAPTVRAVDADGPRTLFSGSGVDLTSLRLRGNVVSWTADGRAAEATLH